MCLPQMKSIVPWRRVLPWKSFLQHKELSDVPPQTGQCTYVSAVSEKTPGIRSDFVIVHSSAELNGTVRVWMLVTGVSAVKISPSKFVREGRQNSMVSSPGNTKIVFLMIGQTDSQCFYILRLFHLDNSSPLLSFPGDVLALFWIASVLLGLRGREIYLGGSFSLRDKEYDAQKWPFLGGNLFCF